MALIPQPMELRYSFDPDEAIAGESSRQTAPAWSGREEPVPDRGVAPLRPLDRSWLRRFSQQLPEVVEPSDG